MDQHSCSQEEPRLLNPASFFTPGPCFMQYLEFLKRVCGLLEGPSLPRGFIGQQGLVQVMANILPRTGIKLPKPGI